MDTTFEVPIPNWKAKEKITQSERDKLMYFNTVRFWHCWFDVKTKKLYDQYGNLTLENADIYLLSINAIDSDMNKIQQFEY